MNFEWDEDKNSKNRTKHGISFQTAALVFADPMQVSIQDRVVGSEERWQTIGQVNGQMLILVAHTILDEHTNEETIRIISARKVEPKEKKRYEKTNQNR